MPTHARVIAPNTIAGPDGVHLFYRDWNPGGRRAVLFVAGWSMPSDSWGYQMQALCRQGLRCLAFDRRGHGRSSDPGGGYDFDTLADDLADVIEALDLRDLTLVGHSMGCNEIVRYLNRHGSARVERVALLGTMTPGVTLNAANPDGIDPGLLVQFRELQLLRDFPLWIEDNIEPFVPGANARMKDWLAQMALGASLQALHDCNLAVQGAEMSEELRRLDLPVLLIAGDRDVSAPLDLTARRSAVLCPQARLRVLEGAGHGMFLTHVERVNADLLEFVRERG
ncbi:MAG TPA: alpha/beta hydrolase [Telluria sp.]|jgi:pimeloyl-ACP methyl ester carboxylesterase